MVHMKRDAGGELNQAEREELRSLNRGPEPPGWLEQRVVDSLRSGGLLASHARQHFAWAWAVAFATACVLCFGAGMLVRSGGVAIPPESTGNRYVLFLTHSSSVASSGPAAEIALVQEYSAWARRQQVGGHLIAGEKLNDASLELSGSYGLHEVHTQDTNLGGYFVIAAPDLDAALAIARTCPHLKHGGTIVIRSIEPTPTEEHDP
jgi:hypothetical protein